MAIESKTLMGTGLAWTVVAAMVLFSRNTSAESPWTGDHQQLRSETRSATNADSGLAPPASGPGSTNDRRPSAKPRDDWELANQLLGAAKAGDREAQYRLFAVIDDCETLMSFYFTQESTPLTLDEGLEKTANASQRHQAQEGFAHCHQYQEHNVAFELGSAEYWLERATHNGQPLAQAVTARRMLDQNSRETAVPLFSKPGAGFSISVSIPSGAPPDRRAVDLLRAAVKSLDPQVLEIVGEEQTQLHGSRMGETVDRFAWVYVACQRGLNCSATSHWATDCPDNCDVSTPEGIIMAWSRDEWPAVQQRAKEINAKLNAGKWDELGLGR